MKLIRSVIVLVVISFLPAHPIARGATGGLLPASTEEKPPAPKEVLGFDPGDDRKLADWSQIVGYFKRLASASGRISLQEPGLTTERRPFIYALISSEENIRNLTAIREAQRKLADPRLISSREEKDRLIRETPAVVAITCSIHSTEIVASQMSMELAYRLASDDSPATRELLHNVVLLLVPSVNPDGIDIVTTWYRKTLGTKYEGTSPPVLYHHYTGHDDNRDWFMLTQVETRELADVLWRQWFPEIVYDVHQQGQFGSRMCVPPFFDPPNPNIDPVILREVASIGMRMSVNLTAAGFKGIVSNSTYDTWWHGGLRTAPYYHNQVGLLTEAASAKIATPMDIKRNQLRSPTRGLQNPLVTATNYPLAWEGGNWRPSDILRMELVTTRTALEEASVYRQSFISNFVEAGSRAIEAGKNEGPFAYVIPESQHDGSAAARMIKILIDQGVEVHRAKSEFRVGDRRYYGGSYVIKMAQPYRANVKCLFEAQHYPDRRVYPGGPAEPPYDVAGWTLPMQMGVDYVAVDSKIDTDLEKDLEKTEEAAPVISLPVKTPGAGAFYISADTDNSFLLVNELQKDPQRYNIFRLIKAANLNGQSYREGGFVVEAIQAGDRGTAETKLKVKASAGALLIDRAAGLGVSVESIGQLDPRSDFRKQVLRPARLGLYKSWSPSMDEGWTRWVLEQFGFDYTSITDADIRAGNLDSRFNVIILPDQSADQITRGNRAGSYPEEYTGGIGDAGVDNLRRFVEAGGTLVCIDSASELALLQFKLPIKNVLNGLGRDKFYAPGSIFRVTVDTSHPLGFGMPGDADVYFISSTRRGRQESGPEAASGPPAPADPNRSQTQVPGSGNASGAVGPKTSDDTAQQAGGDRRSVRGQSRPPGDRAESEPGADSEDGPSLQVRAFAFEVEDQQKAHVVARYTDGDPLRSGWLLGPGYVAGKAALVEAAMGKGRVVLFGFRPQHRAQTWGTFKFLFNSILLAGVNSAPGPR
ncbi:MAG TPA: M14 family metallopeptidase [Blastocatellia bacterium]|nr:M14 family metallopeptidase [Blastocatellia bacterium]